MRAVSQRLPGSPLPSFAGVRKLAKMRSSRTNSRKSAYQTRSWSSSFSLRLPRASNHSIVASSALRVGSSNSFASYERGLKRSAVPAEVLSMVAMRATLQERRQCLRVRFGLGFGFALIVKVVVTGADLLPAVSVAVAIREYVPAARRPPEKARLF